MTHPHDPLLQRLAAALCVPAPRRSGPATDPGIRLDLDDAGALVALDEPWLRSALEAQAAGAPPPAAPSLAAAIAATAGRQGDAALFAGLPAAVAAIADFARNRRPGADATLVVGGPPLCTTGLPAPDSVPAADWRAAQARLSAAPRNPALLWIEPWLDPAGPTGPAAPDLGALLHAARSAGVVTVLDETRCAFRCAPTSVTAALRLQADLVLFGPALAAGLPFAAVVGLPPAAAGDGPDPVTRVVATAVVDGLRRQPVAAPLQRLGGELQAAIARLCAQHQLAADWCGPSAMPALHFRGQENADSGLIEQHFRRELATAGCRVGGPLLLPAGLRRHGLDCVIAMYEQALTRIRALLVEYNSYLSGGLPFVFPAGEAQLRARGLMIYRYPKLAAVEVAPRESAIRIAFAAGELGAVTSSGFYAPTRLSGDVDVRVRYVVQQWGPGPDSACLGLFLQNEASTARYYSQLMSTPDDPDRLTAAAGLAGGLSARHDAGGQGWLRLARTGSTIAASHRPHASAPWVELGRVQGTADDLFVGAKIWSKVRCSGLVVDLHDLQVDGTLAAAQPPLLAPQADPRRT